MDYYKYQIICSPELAEILIAFLSEQPFDTFEETASGLDAFIAVAEDSEAVEVAMAALSTQFNFQFEKELIKAQNWNKIWESNFQPIIVGDFCGIRADFHQLDKEVQHEIIINPKMAFGTGHHATTFMVIEHMKDLDFKNREVLDYGCGTGILAILAAKLGARQIEAVDIELASFENSLENAEINNISCINCVHGTLDNIKGDTFDIILANINRNVILDSLSSLYKRLVKNGILIVSGFIEKDSALLLEATKSQGFLHLKTKNKDNWISMVLEKS
ncbi:MAG: ribosomal protein L11 methyltransferase [Saprospiraceae bacterium]|jgi:ribosomal protein L11 methyltransferase